MTILNKKNLLPFLKAGLLFVFVFLLILPTISSNFNNSNNSLIYRICLGCVVGAATIILNLKFKKVPQISVIFCCFCYFILIFFISIISISDSVESFVSIFGSIAIVCSLFLFAVISKIFNRKEIICFSIIFLLFCFISTTYSLFFECENILLAFKASGENSHYYQIKSFFQSKNLYGFVLFCSIVFAQYLILVVKDRKIKISLLILEFYYFINLIFSRCKICLFLSFVIVFVQIIFFTVRLLKNDKNKAIIFICFLLFLITIATILITVPAIYKSVDFLLLIRHYIEEGFFGQAERSFQSRIHNLIVLKPVIFNWQILFGYGEHITNVFINGQSYSLTMDSGLLGTFFQGGIIKFALLCILVLSSLFKIRFINNKELKLYLFSYLCAGFVYSCFEGYTPLGFTFVSIMLYIVCFVLAGTEFKQQRLNDLNSKKVLHVVGTFQKGGTESFILSYAKQMNASSNFVFDVYTFNGFDEARKKQLKMYGGSVYSGIKPNIKNAIRSYRSFRKFLLDHPEYGIIHCSANFDSFIFLLCANELDLNKRIFHAHDTLDGIKFNFLQKAKLLFKRTVCVFNSNVFLACSEKAGKDIIGERTFSKSGQIINNALDFSAFVVKNEDIIKVKAKYGLNDSYVLGNISRFEEKKNQTFILEIFEEIIKKKPNSILVLGGVDGGLLSTIKDHVKEKPQISNKVVFIGERDDVAVWLHVFDCYLMPSLYEGFGISAIEAQICGTPVLASDRLPSTTDLNVGLIKYIPLDNKEMWIRESIECSKGKNKAKIAGDFDITIAYKKLEKIYLSKMISIE